MVHVVLVAINLSCYDPRLFYSNDTNIMEIRRRRLNHMNATLHSVNNIIDISPLHAALASLPT